MTLQTSVPGATRPSIGEFYGGKAVLVTGATGFLGKVLVEKLLRSCPDVGRIYVLLRPKRGEEVGKRLASLCKSKIFDCLRATSPNALDKLVAINADLATEKLDLSGADRRLLVADVHVVFHCAAATRFNEKLRTAVNMNLTATKRVVELCHEMANLEAFVHVSTAYANCTRGDDIAEKVYPCEYDPEEVIHAMEWMDEKLVDAVTPMLTGGHPNTYTMTKSLAESYVAAACKTLPTAIVRPSMVGASMEEPFPGWVDSKGAATIAMTSVGRGLSKIYYGNGNEVADIIPVDVVCNFIIASGWYTATHSPTENKVYHCTSGSDARATWGILLNFSATFFANNPARGTVRLPSVTFVPMRWLYYILTIFCHVFAAYITDIACWVFVGRWRYARYVYRMETVMESFHFFINHEWRFSAANFWSVYDAMAPGDRKIFNVDTRAMDWTTYLKDYCMGIRSGVMKSDSISDTRVRLIMTTVTLMYRLYMAVCILAGVQLVAALCHVSGLQTKLWIHDIFLEIGPTVSSFTFFAAD